MYIIGVIFFFGYEVLANFVRRVFSGARFYLANKVSNKEQESRGTLSIYILIGEILVAISRGSGAENSISVFTFTLI